jgi:hypothetical protein
MPTASDHQQEGTAASIDHQADPICLLARECVALSLAAFLRDPSIRPINPGELVSYRAAWELFAHLVELVSGSCSASHENCERVLQWLEQPQPQRLMVHQGVFGLLVSGSCPPYETEYVPSDQANHRAHVLADIAGYYQAFGLRPHPGHPERADNAALELEFMAFLLEKMRLAADEPAHHELCSVALSRFFSEHLLWWLPAFSRSVEGRIGKMIGLAPEDAPILRAYQDFAALSRGWLEAEMALLGVPAPQRPVALPVREIVNAMPESCAGCLGAAQEFTCGEGGVG